MVWKSPSMAIFYGGTGLSKTNLAAVATRPTTCTAQRSSRSAPRWRVGATTTCASTAGQTTRAAGF
eukprot:COSAG01_NODE_16176_length_1263_cov_0.932131_2_plen_65_part_01